MTIYLTLKGAAAVAVLMLAVATGACSTATDSVQPSPAGVSYSVSTLASQVTPEPPSTAPLEPTLTPTPDYVGGHPLDTAAVERYIVEYTNQERATEGRSPLSHDPAISDISQDHSKDMAESGEFEHFIDGDGPTDRALDAGYDCRSYHPDGSYTHGLGENIALLPKVKSWQWTTIDARPGVKIWSVLSFYASERSIAEAIVQMWMDSPEHRAGLLKPTQRRMGVGVQVQEIQNHGYIDETVYATQNFSSCEEDDKKPRIEVHDDDLLVQ